VQARGWSEPSCGPPAPKMPRGSPPSPGRHWPGCRRPAAPTAPEVDEIGILKGSVGLPQFVNVLERARAAMERTRTVIEPYLNEIGLCLNSIEPCSNEPRLRLNGPEPCIRRGRRPEPKPSSPFKRVPARFEPVPAWCLHVPAWYQARSTVTRVRANTVLVRSMSCSRTQIFEVELLQ
jgi:hypothetical protein